MDLRYLPGHALLSLYGLEIVEQTDDQLDFCDDFFASITKDPQKIIS